MSNDIFFLAEYADGKPARSALELAAGAADLAAEAGGQAVALAYGDGADQGAAGLGAAGAARAVVLGGETAPAITFAAAAAAAVRDASPLAVLAPATPNGRDLAAALVGLLELPAFGPVRAVSAAGGKLRAEQATLQGSVITVSEPAEGAPQPAVVLVLANTFTPAEGGSGTAEVSQAPDSEAGAFGRARVVESHPAEAAVVNLEEASVIVAGGRGVGSEEGFAPLHELADVLGGAVGASRAAADAGWIPYQLQIGQTGKVVKPALYIGVGISGAIQHRVGMQSAENVLAINKDPDAPIGEFADLFVVGDLFQIIPKLTEEIRRRKA
ncbi:MAG TPA: electron transfer flavoprotein subunit alpha/FixB family protein [Candidatus Limnocylindrales bacterium]|nr:electron transfer flavoprotein subunit alpha/FixB family protein [Candidatus Limnocylindrales bacterium]